MSELFHRDPLDLAPHAPRYRPAAWGVLVLGLLVAAAGASAAIVQADHSDAFMSLPESIAVISVPQTRPALASAAAWFYGHPGREMTVIGITGTDGKTTTSHMLTSVLEAAGHTTSRLALARAVERVAESALSAKYPDRPLRANVEFYTSVLLDAVGLPRALFSPTFAVARAAGWCAHIAEQRAVGKLIRPSSKYLGERRTSV